MKYLLLKHYRGAPEPAGFVPMDQWTPEEFDAHVQYMNDFAARLEETGEFVDSQALAPEGTFVRYDGEDRPPVTDGPFAETKDLIAGWMVIDVDSYERAIELAADLVLISKTDLLPYLEFDLRRCVADIGKISPAAQVLPVSARSGDGMSHWHGWLRDKISR